MSILDLYKKKNSEEDWFKDYSTLARGMHGRMFEYTNTNFRTQESFIEQFIRFSAVEDMPREQWSKQENHGQEVDKHRVINMIQSKLFKKNTDGLYSKTTKGSAYNEFIKVENLSENDRWFLNYLFLINGYYFNRENYIIGKVKDVWNSLMLIEGVTSESLFNQANELINNIPNGRRLVLRSKFFYVHSFYNDPDFLVAFFRAGDVEIEELASYIEDNLNKKTGNCCISKKYETGGNFNLKMLLDEVKVFTITLDFVRKENLDIEVILPILLDSHKRNAGELNENVVSEFIESNKNVFDIIFSDILGNVDYVDTGLTEYRDRVISLEIKDEPEEYIDDTSREGMIRIKSDYSLKKKQARILSKFTCALEKINNCRQVYFTAKATSENYLELHHFIPREFRNDFAYSIEVFANYVTLCPRCHRQLHYAVDRERIPLINTIFEERKDRLTVVGLGIDLVGIYQYYRVEDQNPK